jgi:hypothetical protein
MKRPVMALAIVAVAAGLTNGSEAQEESIKTFVESYAAPSPAMDKMAKWVRGICPITAGLPAAFNAQVTRRVREVATQVGAPVAPSDGKETCKPNIDIVFALQPQPLLDDIRKRQPVYLGYHDMARAAQIATVRFPVQAWYATETEDLQGMKQIDYPWSNRGVWVQGEYLSNAKDARSTGSRVSDGLHSNFYHVVIVVDLHKVNGQEIEPLADDIAVLALSQPQSFDSCLTPASITNLMAPECTAKTKAITAMDLAYLRSLYKTDSGTSFTQQKNQIAHMMSQGLAGN